MRVVALRREQADFCPVFVGLLLVDPAFRTRLVGV